MGSWFSSDKSKTIDTAGTVNNNITVEEPIDSYSITIVTLLATLCVLRVLECVFNVYRYHVKTLKKKYRSSNASRS